VGQLSADAGRRTGAIFTGLMLSSRGPRRWGYASDRWVATLVYRDVRATGPGGSRAG